MAAIRKPILADDGKQILCRKCGRSLGLMDDDGVFVAGGTVKLWNDTRYSCLCGRTYVYHEILIDQDGESSQSSTIGVPPDRKESVLEMLNELGKNYSPAWIEQKKRKAS
jgi:4-alpha-glucanotransferase